MMNVHCKVEKGSLMENQTGVLDPEEKFKRRYAVAIVKIVATVNNGVIPVRMFNPHSKPQRIYKGSAIGQLYQLSATTEKNEQEQPCYYVCQSLSPLENNEDTVSKDVCSKSLKELENLFRIDNVNISTAEKN